MLCDALVFLSLYTESKGLARQSQLLHKRLAAGFATFKLFPTVTLDQAMILARVPGVTPTAQLGRFHLQASVFTTALFCKASGSGVSHIWAVVTQLRTNEAKTRHK